MEQHLINITERYFSHSRRVIIFCLSLLFCLVAYLGNISIGISAETKVVQAQHLQKKQHPQKSKQTSPDLSEYFISVMFGADSDEKQAATRHIAQNWYPELASMAIDTLRFTNDSFSFDVLSKLIDQEVGEIESANSKETQFDRWYRWLWNSGLDAPTGYANYKARIYKTIDPRFERYFKDRQDTARVRLDEIRWGGVEQDGIPPLRQPIMIKASEEQYLADSNIVFGIYLNGEAKAYPKRVLAWHEIFIDTIGGVEIAGVYCTLCGAVIPYRTEFKGKRYELGTSGFLYRSNKLMYDKATQSLWSTHEGKPVLGELVDKGIQLEFEAVVTTTWGEWRKRHPDTLVLSQNTGHFRDYREGVAYAAYFRSDDLMFETPFQDNRLKNKQEVLALRFPAAPKDQLAIDTEFLKENRVFQTKIGGQKILVLTDNTGANRVYDPEEFDFIEFDTEQRVVSADGQKWTISETNLINDNGRKLSRLPAHRAFWFGWHAAFPKTQLIQ
jgi:hypothetical protein